MFATSTIADWAVLVGAVCTGAAVLIAAFTGMIVSLRGQNRIERKVDHANGQLETLNGGTVGSFASADETRRVAAIPYAERTVSEQEHMDAAPPLGVAQGPAVHGVPPL